jgi:hypothetical protein
LPVTGRKELRFTIDGFAKTRSPAAGNAMGPAGVVAKVSPGPFPYLIGGVPVVPEKDVLDMVSFGDIISP